MQQEEGKKKWKGREKEGGGEREGRVGQGELKFPASSPTELSKKAGC